MTIRANIVADTSNNTVIVDSVTGIVREDIFVSNITLRARNVRVLETFSSNNVVLLTQNVNIISGNVVQFQKLVSGLGLIAGDSQIAYFMRDKPSYNPAIDPRLPKSTKLAGDLFVDDAYITVYGNVSTTGIVPVAVPRTAVQNVYGTTIEFQTTSDVQVGDFLLSNSLGLVSNVRVAWVGEGNANVGFNKPTIAGVGQTFLFRRPVQPAVRVGPEVIYYSNTSINPGTITLTNLVRNIANTQPIDRTITSLAQASTGTVLNLADTTGIKVADYVIINNTTLNDNVQVLWVPTGEGNANVGISTSITADLGTAVTFQRDRVWAANTTVSILGSIPL